MPAPMEMAIHALIGRPSELFWDDSSEVGEGEEAGEEEGEEEGEGEGEGEWEWAGEGEGEWEWECPPPCPAGATSPLAHSTVRRPRFWREW